MNCPECNGDNISVTDSRAKPSVIWRRRKCNDCDHRFRTEERHKPYDFEKKRKILKKHMRDSYNFYVSELLTEDK